MHKQLLLFHNAISAYFSGNEKSLEATMKQFSINHLFKVIFRKTNYRISHFLSKNVFHS